VRNRRAIFVFTLLMALPLFAASDSHAAAASVVVVASVGVEAHRWAIEGIQAALATSAFRIRVVDLEEARSGLAAGVRLAMPGARVIIAVGSEALQIVEGERPTVPVISTMVLLHTDERSVYAPVAATIAIDVSMESMLARLKQLFPQKNRIGILRNPASVRSTPAQLQARAQTLGYTVRVVDSGDPQQLLPALMSLKGQVDFVWCLPDGTIYNSVTIRPLILASIQNRLPLIGFSESFARAGAAVSIYPDFRDVGLQTGEAARQLMDNQPLGTAGGPRKLKLAINQSVVRLLGLRYSPEVAATKEVSVLP